LRVEYQRYVNAPRNSAANSLKRGFDQVRLVIEADPVNLLKTTFKAVASIVTIRARGARRHVVVLALFFDSESRVAHLNHEVLLE
jgi:hypothetical protein